MIESTTYVGMDVHKKEIVVALLRPGVEEPIEWKLPNEPRAIRRLAKRLRREARGSELRCVYEAGPCGYTLQRQLLGEGIRTDVIAPSLIPVKPGERITLGSETVGGYMQLIMDFVFVTDLFFEKRLAAASS